ncbi:MAG: DUF3084 domain-containing protein [Synechococcus sp. Tobar2m-G35]|nr:DUF3084 domain-containing protein [Synechococcus sp. Tobar2m-G35]
MTGWLLILAVLVLGGVLSTLGDRLGSRIGKARLTLFGLRPRRTAVLITVLTGSLISALTLGLMVSVSERLRTGLFQLDQLEGRLRSSRQALQASIAQLSRSQVDLNRSRNALGRSAEALRQADRDRSSAEAGRLAARDQLQQVQSRARQLRAELTPLQRRRQQLEQERDRLGRDVQRRDEELRQLQERTRRGQAELRDLEGKVLALRSGDVVLSSGQPLTMAKVSIPRSSLARQAVEDVLRQANGRAFEQVLPGQQVDRQLLLIPRSEVRKIERAIAGGGTWVVSILSAGNVLRGEKQVLAFADVRPSQRVIESGQVLASVILDPTERSPDQVRARLNLLLAATRTAALREGVLAPTIQFAVEPFNDIGRQLSDQPRSRPVQIQTVAVRDSDTSDPVRVEVRVLAAAGALDP